MVFHQLSKKYDVIWEDAATPNGVPNVFKTEAFQQTLRSHLEPDGIVIANLWERSAEGLNRVASTYKNGLLHGIRVKVPLAINEIIAVGNHATLTCENFWDQYSSWYHSADFPLKWKSQRDLRESKIWQDLHQPH